MQFPSRFNKSSEKAQLSGNWLLELPEAALDLVLQQLDLCSLASLAVSCSEFRQSIPAHTRQLSVRCNSWESFESFASWLQQNITNLDNLTQCSVVGIWQDWSRLGFHSTRALQSLCQLTLTASSCTLRLLPCPQLRQLQLQNLNVQLEP